MSKELLRVTDLNIEFHDHLIPETVVFDFDLTMEQGEIVGLVGESGSGKSMSALAIAGLLSRKDMQKRGEILFEGVDLLTCERKALRQLQGNEIGMIFQEPMTSLNPVKKVGWQVEEALRIHTKLSKQERYERAVRMLSEVELDHPERIYHQYPHELSGGMRQRVMIAAAMICEPKLLIADEPTTALDVTIQAQIMKLLGELQRENGMSIVLITHDIGLVAQMADRVIVMYAGQIVEEAPVKELFESPRHPYTRALLETVPTIRDNADRQLISIPGMVPENYDDRTGCRFADRCAFRRPECGMRQEDYVFGPGHRAKCVVRKREQEREGGNGHGGGK